MKRTALVVTLIMIGLILGQPLASHARGGYHGGGRFYGGYRGYGGWYGPRVYIGPAYPYPYYYNPYYYPPAPPVYGAPPAYGAPPGGYPYPDPSMTPPAPGDQTGSAQPPMMPPAPQYQTGNGPLAPGQSTGGQGDVVTVPGQWVNGTWVPEHQVQLPPAR